MAHARSGTSLLPPEAVGASIPTASSVARVVVAKTAGAMRIVACNAAAQAAGLDAGLALAQAQAMYPGLVIQPHDAAADARLLEHIADWADRYTPFVGRTPPDGLMLDITGAAHLAGGETALLADVQRRLAAQGFHVRVGLAGTVGAASALARFGRSGVSATNGEERTALAALPVAALRIDAAMVAGLRRAGLKTIGDVMTRPRAPLAARFGPWLLHRLDQALGIDAEAITPRQPIPAASVAMTLVEPITREQDVSHAALHLARQLCALLVERGQGARHLVLTVFRVDGAVRRVEIGTAEPCRDPDLLHRLLALRLSALEDPLDAGYGFDRLCLSATSVGVQVAEALVLGAGDPAGAGFGAALGSDGARDRGRQVSRLADRLAARFGRAQVLRLLPQDTHVPELATQLVPVGQTPPAATGLPAAPTAPAIQFDNLGPLRPLRLFDPPEPVEIIAEVPDGPPLRLRWRRQSLRILVAEGPERIAIPWWSQAQARGGFHPLPRDYYRVADETGRRLWVFREGLYTQPQDHLRDHLRDHPQDNPQDQLPTAPRWFVHGLFA
jgi:protein ImuB